MANSEHLSSKLCAYPEKGKSAALPSVLSLQIGLFNVRAVNNSGGTANVGLGRVQGAASLDYFSLASQTPTSGVYVSLPKPSTAFPQQAFSGAVDAGFVIGSRRPLNLIGVHVSTTNTSGTFKIEQWNGSAWVLVGDVLEQPADYDNGATPFDAYHVMSQNTGVVKGADAALNAVALESQNKYFTRIYASAGLGGAVLVDELWAMSFLELRRGIINNGQVVVQLDWRQFFPLEAEEGFAPYFSAPDPKNQFGAFWSTVG